MYQVNLLPWREAALQRRARRYLALLLLLNLLLLALAASAFWRGQSARSHSQAALLLLDQRYEALSAEYQRTQQAQAALTRLAQQQQTRQQLAQRNSRYLALLQHLPLAIPDNVWLTSLQDRGEVLELRGISQDYFASMAFMHSLAQGGQLWPIVLSELQLQQDRHYRFMLSASWRSREVQFD